MRTLPVLISYGFDTVCPFAYVGSISGLPATRPDMKLAPVEEPR